MNILDLIRQKPKRVPLCIVSNYPEIEAASKQFDLASAAIQKEHDDFHKVLEKKVNGLSEGLWLNAEMLLRERNLLPSDYSKEKYALSIDDGVVFLNEKIHQGEDFNGL